MCWPAKTFGMVKPLLRLLGNPALHTDRTVAPVAPGGMIPVRFIVLRLPPSVPGSDPVHSVMVEVCASGFSPPASGYVRPPYGAHHETASGWLLQLAGQRWARVYTRRKPLAWVGIGRACNGPVTTL